MEADMLTMAGLQDQDIRPTARSEWHSLSLSLSLSLCVCVFRPSLGATLEFDPPSSAFSRNSNHN